MLAPGRGTAMLVGRDAERLEIEGALARAQGGKSATLALIGEPGIGKTALLEHAAARAEGMQLLRARGVEPETRVAFAALLELVRPALGLLGQIPTPQARALEVALALRSGTGGDRFAVGAATLSLLAAYAEQAPALLLVDDAHLLDASSAEALLFALRRLLAEPVCVLLAVREGEPSLLDDADVPRLELGGLDRDAAASLIGSVPGAVVDRLYEATGGNPLALLALREDVARHAGEPVAVPMPLPAAISRAFARRAETLAEPARRLLVLLAAADGGEISSLERAAASLGLDLEDLDAAEHAGLVRNAGARVEFRHPLAQAAIYGEAAPAARRAAHRALADALPDRDADLRAWHLAAAAVGTDEGVAAALEQAGRRARGRSGYAVAAAAFERAAQLAADERREAALLFAAADAAWSAGLADRATPLLARARDLGAGAERALEIERLAGRIAVRRGPVMDGHAILLAAAERAAASDPELAIGMLAEAVDACFYAGDAHAMELTARRIGALERDALSIRARFLARITRGMALVFAGEGAAGVSSIREAIALAESSAWLRGEVQLQPWLVMGPLWVRELDAGQLLIAAAIEHARAQATLGVLPWLLNRVARGHAATESWSAASVEYDEAIRLARESGQRVELAAALAGLAWLEAREGREQSARAHAAEASALCVDLGVGLYGGWVMRALGELELGLGRPAGAVEHLERMEAHLAELGVGDIDVCAGAELVDAYLRLGRREDALATGERFAQRAREKGQPWSAARAERCLGLLAGDQDFEPHFENALDLHERTPDLFELAMTRLAYGSRLRRARHRRRAREQLRGALDAFEHLGAAPFAEQARSELAATGETARRRGSSTLDELTPQELHIARLLGAGKTTREVAAALFLSPKTIEYHLRSVYRKLGVKSRPELAQALGARELAGEEAAADDA